MAIQRITGRIIEDGAIEVADVADNAVTAAKIASGSITTAKIADGNVTAAKIDTVANTQVTGVMTTAQVADEAINVSKLATTVAGALGVRNRIINGDMRIDQRNAGSSLTITANPQYTVDRWWAGISLVSKISVQQSSTAPTGFTKSMLVTSLAATTPGTSELYYMQQSIEGYNVSDLDFGLATAKTITISFWVRSSLTGAFGAVLLNAGSNRSFPFNYTISTADTWTKITQTIIGDTTGTWATDNSVGFQLRFGLGAGATYQGTAGSWGTTNAVTTTGATSVVGTSGATLYITGVQLEVGTEATPFEHRPYDMELARCERYYQKNYLMEDAPGVSTSGENSRYMHGSSDGSGNGAAGVFWRCRMRATPTVTWYADSGTQGQWNYARNGASGVVTFTAYRVGDTGANGFLGVGASWITCSLWGNWTANAEL